MRPYLLIIIALLTAACNKHNSRSESDLQALYSELDYEIAHSKDYEEAKEKRITQLHRDYDFTHNQNERTEILNKLIEEYNAYNADSTLYYIAYNQRRHAVQATPGEYTRLSIKRADVLAHAGLFSDALSTMRQIPRDSIDDSLLEAYYSTYCALYQYLSEYTNAHETSLSHEKKRALYADSLRQVITPESFNHVAYVMAELARNGDYATAISGLLNHLDKYASGTREYSILASTLADIYKTADMPNEYKRYLVLSAISDVKGAVKENMSFRAVATVMFEEGDIERANRYLKKSIADANFYSALLRNAQSSKMLPIIDEAYTAVQNKLTKRLQIMVGISSILSIILMVTIFLILKQFKSLRRAKDNMSLANEELSKLSIQLKEANEELKNKNAELKEFNRTKEQYAGLFMEYCSSAISSLQHYQLTLRNLTAMGGNRAALLKKLESTEVADQLLKNFYIKFDEAILNIFPLFVEKFNALLKPDERVVLKTGELLNTELRLYALIRIGIEDNAKIAEFLRCSISTVYTYRSKMKKRAVNPSEFENKIKELG